MGEIKCANTLLSIRPSKACRRCSLPTIEALPSTPLCRLHQKSPIYLESAPLLEMAVDLIDQASEPDDVLSDTLIGSVTPQSSSSRWWVLTVFCLAAITQACTWNIFSPIADSVRCLVPVCCCCLVLVCYSAAAAAATCLLLCCCWLVLLLLVHSAAFLSHTVRCPAAASTLLCPLLGALAAHLVPHWSVQRSLNGAIQRLGRCRCAWPLGKIDGLTDSSAGVPTRPTLLSCSHCTPPPSRSIAMALAK